MKIYAFLLLFLLAGISQAYAIERQQIRIVGSGTVFPFAALAAEQFGDSGKYRTPVIEATGTGGGFKIFCSGVGLDTPDINDASRPMTASEKSLCNANSVIQIYEIPLGFDGIVFASKISGKALSLSKKDIFLALARELPDTKGQMRSNPNKTWQDVNPDLPKRPIKVYGPSTVSGTRDAFVELVMEQGCEQVPAYIAAYSDSALRKKKCQLIREDGAYIEAGEDYNILVQKLIGDENAIGLFGFNFFDENKDRIQANSINGVMPSVKSISDGSYGISRKLYMYVKGEHITLIPGLHDFLKEVTGEAAIGEEGYLTAKGLVPLSLEQRQVVRNTIGLLAK